MTSIKPASETAGLYGFERRQVAWAERFAANCSSGDHHALLADLDGITPPEPGRSDYPAITGRAASVTSSLLRIIARQAAELEQAKAQRDEMAAIAREAIKTAQTGADLATDSADARFARYAAEQTGMLI